MKDMVLKITRHTEASPSLLDMATAAVAAAPTSTGLRSSVLGGYRRLMRLRMWDQYAIDQARLQLRAE